MDKFLNTTMGPVRNLFSVDLNKLPPLYWPRPTKRYKTAAEKTKHVRDAEAYSGFSPSKHTFLPDGPDPVFKSVEIPIRKLVQTIEVPKNSPLDGMWREQEKYKKAKQARDGMMFARQVRTQLAVEKIDHRVRGLLWVMLIQTILIVLAVFLIMLYAERARGQEWEFVDPYYQGYYYAPPVTVYEIPSRGNLYVVPERFGTYWLQPKTYIYTPEADYGRVFSPRHAD